METKTLKHQIANGFIWSLSERLAAQGIMMVVSIVLARLVEPSEYGIVSIVTVFVTFADIFVSGGFGSALVQKKDADELDYNTAFSISFIISIILYLVLFVASDYIGIFYNMEELGAVLKIMGLRLPIAAINTVQHSVIQRNMEFKKFFFATLIGTIISAFVGIYLAYSGYGVWALVGQYMSNTLIDTLVLLVIENWKPKFRVSLKKAKGILSFGWKVFLQKLSYTLTGNIQSLVIGKQFSSEDLAFYNNGTKIPDVILSNIYDTMGKVLFPAISKVQDDSEKKKELIRQSVSLATFFLAPMALGLVIIGKPLVYIMYTEKWAACIPFLQIFCIRFLTRPLTTILQQAVFAIGRSDIVLVIDTVTNAMILGMLAITAFVFKSVIGVALGVLPAVVAGFMIYVWIGKKYFRYGFKEQFIDMMPSYFCAIIMGIITHFLSFLISNSVALLVFQILVGVCSYFVLSVVLNRKTLRIALELMNNYVKKMHHKHRKSV